MLNSVQPQFIFDIRSNIKIKVFDLHIVKPYICYVTANHVLQLWDYERKFCIRALSIHDLDGTIEKVSEIRQVRFYDKQTIQWLFGGPKKQEFDGLSQPCIMVLNQDRLYLYYYESDKTDVLTQTQIDSKGGNRCLEFIDGQYIAIGGENGVRIIDIKLAQLVKTIKGYHQKAMNIFLSYRQNEMDRPRLIAASLDGTMACWNVDTAVETPAFKFLMTKKGKQLLTANDGQEILSIAYDPHEYQIVTVCEDYVTLWSSLNSMEINRFKNGADPAKINIKELCFLSHSSMPKSTYIGHARGPEIYSLHIVAKVQDTSSTKDGPRLHHLEPQVLLDLRTIQDSLKILSLQVNPVKNGYFVAGTTQGIYLCSLEAHPINKIEIHNSFICPLTFQQAKEFVDNQGFQKKISNVMHEKLRGYEQTDKQNQIFNFIYLSVVDRSIVGNLFEIQVEERKEEWGQLLIKSRMYKFEKEFLWSDVDLTVSPSGKFVCALNKQNGAFHVLQINNKNLVRESELIDGVQAQNTLHFLSQFDRLVIGCALSAVWCQQKEELYTISPINDRGELITLEEKLELQTSGGFFKQRTSTKSSVYLSSPIKCQVICVYACDASVTPSVVLRHKITTMESPLRLFSLCGMLLVVTPVTPQLLADLASSPISVADKTTLKTARLNLAQLCRWGGGDLQPIPGAIFVEPLLAKCSMSGRIMVLTYPLHSQIYRFEGGLTMCRQINDKVIDVYFWEDLLFCITEVSIKLIVCMEELIILEIANLELPTSIYDICEFLREHQSDMNYFDSLQPDIQQRPSGQLKILMIYDCRLVLINQAEDLFYLNLTHPYIQFLMHLEYQQFDTCIELSSKLDKNTHKQLAQHFIHKKAFAEVASLHKLSLLDRLQLELHHFEHPVTLLTLDNLQTIMNQVKKHDREQVLAQLATQMSQRGREDETDLIVSYGIQKDIFSQSSIIPLLSRNRDTKNIHYQKIGLHQDIKDFADVLNDPEQLELVLQQLYQVYQLEIE